MTTNPELIYHFTCEKCKLWWSIATTDPLDKKTWYCPWCSHKHKPPHKEIL